MNLDNITISDANIFDMTEEAKNNLLNSFTNAVKTGDIDLEKATGILKAVTDFLETLQIDTPDNESLDLIKEIKKILSKISQTALAGEEVAEEIELAEDEGLEVVAADEALEILDEADEDTEVIELAEDEELEEIELPEDADLEEIEEGEPEPEESIADDIIEELDDDTEVVAEDDPIELEADEELEILDGADEDTEVIELAEDEELEEIELPEGEDLEEVEPLEDEELEEIEPPEDADFEEIEDAEEASEEPLEDDIIEELDDDTEVVAEDDPIELEADEELEILDEADEDTQEIELAEDEDLEEIELAEGEDLEMVEGLDKEELAALEDFREQRKLAEHFDDTLGEREKKFNVYVTVPKGKYTIGTQKSLKASLELQQFDMPEVHIGRYPVTNSLFEIFIDQTGYVTTAEKKGIGIVYQARYKKTGKTASWNKSAGSKDVKGACWHKPSGPGSTLHGKRNHPVVQVSIEDAFAYASWIGRRLPTEAEWESAARTDLGYPYPWGDEFKLTALNIEKSGLSDTCPVDEYDDHANELKIVDMLGNVMEWTSDMEKPPFKTKPNTPYCIAKGGAWNSGSNLTISSRALFKSGFSANTIGFRCISEIFL
ncbi:MAG: formylglycine-generating enzyme family protein [Proteobacteria bacterium]|nr:formylglycine-generating enzyme family protein [Desulfobacula sp.]MBU4129345.1 formylglycine-generating enzyme family protein [Pseudomonadota bacterium]